MSGERRFNWQWWAACKGLPAAAFVPEPQRGGHRRPPLLVEALCPTCPVRDQCEQYGRDTGSVGWWGGVLLSYGDALHELKGPPPDLTEVAALYHQGGVEAVKARFEIANSTAWRLISRAVAAGLAERRRSRSRLPFTPVEIADIRARWAAGGVLQRELAAEYGAAESTISCIVRDMKRDQEIRACHSA